MNISPRTGMKFSSASAKILFQIWQSISKWINSAQKRNNVTLFTTKESLQIYKVCFHESQYIVHVALYTQLVGELPAHVRVGIFWTFSQSLSLVHELFILEERCFCHIHRLTLTEHLYTIGCLFLSATTCRPMYDIMVHCSATLCWTPELSLCLV
jgi:hypothetical protein